MLVGMIEDGELPPDRRLDEEEKQEMREALGRWVVDSCPGPTIESNQANFAITCTAMDQLENSGINR